MSRFLSKKHERLSPYAPGEQPRRGKYIKLNTNESPYPPSEKARRYAADAARKLELYPDPECGALREKAAAYYGVAPEELIFSNGSVEVLNFAFMAFCGDERPALFPNISYGFYPVFAALNRVPYEEISLREDFSIAPADYAGKRAAIFIANPNAPTGIALPRAAVEEILRGSPDSIVIVDEAYVDFGAESCVPLIRSYDNLLVTQTFSKSRSMAGARLGIGIGNRELIRDLKTMQYSTNPYNVNSMTMAAALGALEDEEYFKENCEKIARDRAWTAERLRGLGFELTDSASNFLFAGKTAPGGRELYLRLREKGILVRHFDKPGLSDYLRITVGSREQMEAL
ncbi:MAG: histidinol-phosphate transaminase, partial [Clostridia bacterium]|nr:histidinol-phosphate transaminase [Clostridia bacterium]